MKIKMPFKVIKCIRNRKFCIDLWTKFLWPLSRQILTKIFFDALLWWKKNLFGVELMLSFSGDFWLYLRPASETWRDQLVLKLAVKWWKKFAVFFYSSSLDVRWWVAGKSKVSTDSQRNNSGSRAVSDRQHDAQWHQKLPNDFGHDDVKELQCTVYGRLRSLLQIPKHVETGEAKYFHSSF